MTIKKLAIASTAAMLMSNLAWTSELDDFTRLDIDQDGRLSSAEFAKQSANRGGSRRGVRSNPSVDRFSAADADGDGYLSPSEFSAASSKRSSRDRQ